jgi:hypothetical protein
MTTSKARNHQMRFSSLLYPHATIIAKHKQHIAVSADSPLIFCWQTYFCSHSNFSRNLYVTAGELRIFSTRLFSLLE